MIRVSDHIERVTTIDMIVQNLYQLTNLPELQTVIQPKLRVYLFVLFPLL